MVSQCPADDLHDQLHIVLSLEWMRERTHLVRDAAVGPVYVYINNKNNNHHHNDATTTSTTTTTTTAATATISTSSSKSDTPARALECGQKDVRQQDNKLQECNDQRSSRPNSFTIINRSRPHLIWVRRIYMCVRMIHDLHANTYAYLRACICVWICSMALLLATGYGADFQTSLFSLYGFCSHISGER